MTDLPAPPVPVDCDLRGMSGFMLDSERLLASELWALATGDEFKAAMGLWCRAWRQVPAASLPDDDRVLAAFAGVPLAWWRKHRAMVMRGFIACSDGRLYHRVLAEDAKRAWRKRQAFRDRATKAAQARWEQSQEHATSMPQASTKHLPSISQAMLGDAQGQGQGHNTRINAAAAAAAVPSPVGAPAKPPQQQPDGFREWRVRHPRIYVSPNGASDMPSWEALWRWAGADPLDHAYRVLIPTVDRGRRLTCPQVTEWIERHYEDDQEQSA